VRTCSAHHVRHGLTATRIRVGIDLISYATKYATKMKE